MQPSFSPALWQNNVCSHSQPYDYDQDGYNRYVKMVRDSRIAAAVMVALICGILVTIGGACLRVAHDADRHHMKHWGMLSLSLAAILPLIIVICIRTSIIA